MFSGGPRIEFPDSLKTWQVCLLRSKEADTEWQSFWSENDVAPSLMITVAAILITADDNCCHIPHCVNDNWVVREWATAGLLSIEDWIYHFCSHHSHGNLKLNINSIEAKCRLESWQDQNRQRNSLTCPIIFPVEEWPHYLILISKLWSLMAKWTPPSCHS